MDTWLMAEVLALASGDDVHDARGILACYRIACESRERPELAPLDAEDHDCLRLRAAVYELILRRYRGHRIVGERVRIRDVKRAVCGELLADGINDQPADGGVLPCRVR